ncbi:thiosulfate oxidation carrier protein SoxY [Sabulicella rubraurantiaca]|uniref:thiosulfate oxidation carrier protein SoxY n=1 Tax=Sabulicella rubraurantiaca TaxID=2811429 RepID=UPI001A9693BF|nr:thiosulfate oxidation carrier protein SoxY [Sabulicella rubraurantiaca]
MRRRAALALSLTLLPLGTARAQDATLEEAIRAQIGDRTTQEGGIALRAPVVAENGGQVPVTVSVDSPQTAESHVTAIHLFATRNPTPGIASFRLTPLLARAEVQTRIRLAEGQVVVAVAQLSDGTARRVSAEIRVTTGGCLS